ncbi:hypothetical protein AB0E56_03200 [Microbacterium sp. NPDC028030]|uniref:hypothetical protein n=1 Tax=Microbacterium sp. NPDC028030 TaxID=3155124 RepID=UPI0033E11A4F
MDDFNQTSDNSERTFTPEELEQLFWHLPINETEVEWCEHPAACPLPAHVQGMDEATEMERLGFERVNLIPLPQTKADLKRRARR